jgi:hypothetical protein
VSVLVAMTTAETAESRMLLRISDACPCFAQIGRRVALTSTTYFSFTPGWAASSGVDLPNASGAEQCHFDHGVSS